MEGGQTQADAELRGARRKLDDDDDQNLMDARIETP
jgi:hypothetical protein